MEGSINTKINRGKGGTYYIAARIDTQDPVSLQKFNELMGALNTNNRLLEEQTLEVKNSKTELNLDGQKTINWLTKSQKK